MLSRAPSLIIIVVLATHLFIEYLHLFQQLFMQSLVYSKLLNKFIDLLLFIPTLVPLDFSLYHFDVVGLRWCLGCCRVLLLSWARVLGARYWGK